VSADDDLDGAISAGPAADHSTSGPATCTSRDGGVRQRCWWASR
jgi:hypothetical protein